MTPSTIAKMVFAMLLPELAKAGSSVPWRAVKARFDVTLQRAIPLHWIEGPIQKAGDSVLDGCAVAWADTAFVQAVTQALASGDVPKAEALLIGEILKVAPNAGALLAA